MNKLQWEEAHEEFNSVLSELSGYEREYYHGSNKKIRDRAERQMEDMKHRIQYLFKKYPDVYQLLIGDNISDYSQAIIIGEFYENRHIVHDLGMLLLHMREKIKSFGDAGSGSVEG
ncbi:hypothetical protein JMG10_03415 [Nostoc ellipsosporum NOK]|nr:hypothetical protein [Nostoc ellipsosporum NOK]